MTTPALLRVIVIKYQWLMCVRIVENTAMDAPHQLITMIAQHAREINFKLLSTSVELNATLISTQTALTFASVSRI